MFHPAAYVGYEMLTCSLDNLTTFLDVCDPSWGKVLPLLFLSTTSYFLTLFLTLDSCRKDELSSAELPGVLASIPRPADHVTVTHKWER